MQEKEIFLLLDENLKINDSLTYGVHLAKRLNAKAILLAIKEINLKEMPAALHSTGQIHLNENVLKSFEEQVFPQLIKISLQLKPIWNKIHSKATVGYIDKQTINLVDEGNPNLLLIEGKSDLNTLNEWFGTYETRIAEGTDCPVLIVPPKTRWKPINKLLYIMNQQDAKVENMRILTRLADQLDTQIQVVLHSDKNDPTSKSTFKEMVDIFHHLLNYKEVSFHQIYGQKSSDEFTKIVELIQPDWLVFEQKNRTFIERVFDDYNTKRLILQSDIPVMVF